MWRSLLLFVICFLYAAVHAKLIITDFDYHYNKDGVVLRCLYDNGVTDKNDSVQFFVNNTLLYSFDGQPVMHSAIDGVQLDSENSNSTHLALKRIERRISGMFRCEVKSRKTIERTKVERKFVFDLPMLGYSRRQLRREPSEATVRPANGTHNAVESRFGQPTDQRANDAVTNYEHNYRTSAIQRAAGQRGMLTREAAGEMVNVEVGNSRASQIDRSVERQQGPEWPRAEWPRAELQRAEWQRAGQQGQPRQPRQQETEQQRNFNYPNEHPESGSKERFVIVNRAHYGDRFRRVKKEEPVDLNRMANGGRMSGGRAAGGVMSQSLRLADPVPRFAAGLMRANLLEEDARRPSESVHDLDGSREIPLTQQELESSNEIIKKEYLGYWTRINLVKLYSEITNIKRRIGMQPRIYPNRIQP